MDIFDFFNKFTLNEVITLSIAIVAVIISVWSPRFQSKFAKLQIQVGELQNSISMQDLNLTQAQHDLDILNYCNKYSEKLNQIASLHAKLYKALKGPVSLGLMELGDCFDRTMRFQNSIEHITEEFAYGDGLSGIFNLSCCAVIYNHLEYESSRITFTKAISNCSNEIETVLLNNHSRLEEKTINQIRNLIRFLEKRKDFRILFDSRISVKTKISEIFEQHANIISEVDSLIELVLLEVKNDPIESISLSGHGIQKNIIYLIQGYRQIFQFYQEVATNLRTTSAIDRFDLVRDIEHLKNVYQTAFQLHFIQRSFEESYLSTFKRKL